MLPYFFSLGVVWEVAATSNCGRRCYFRKRKNAESFARLTETVVMWLSDEDEFWSVLEHDSAPLWPFGLQQLMLDMHFIVEIARLAGYPSRHLHKISSDIIPRAVKAFSARGIDPKSSLPEDEWFVETEKGAITKLLMGGSGSDISDTDEEDEHIIIGDEVISDSDNSPSSLSSVETEESFGRTGEPRVNRF